MDDLGKGGKLMGNGEGFGVCVGGERVAVVFWWRLVAGGGGSGVVVVLVKSVIQVTCVGKGVKGWWISRIWGENQGKEQNCSVETVQTPAFCVALRLTSRIEHYIPLVALQIQVPLSTRFYASGAKLNRLFVSLGP